MKLENKNKIHIGAKNFSRSHMKVSTNSMHKGKPQLQMSAEKSFAQRSYMEEKEDQINELLHELAPSNAKSSVALSK